MLGGEPVAVEGAARVLLLRHRHLVNGAEACLLVIWRCIVGGDRAAVEYWAILRVEGKKQTLAGATLLRFDADGLVVEHRYYWALEPGRRERPAAS